MERRSFLQGLFGGVVTGGVILQANDEEIAAFASGLAPHQPVITNKVGEPKIVMQPGQTLYNEHGEAVLLIRSFSMERESIDITMAHDPHLIFVPGILTVHLTCSPIEL